MDIHRKFLNFTNEHSELNSYRELLIFGCKNMVFPWLFFGNA